MALIRLPRLPPFPPLLGKAQDLVDMPPLGIFINTIHNLIVSATYLVKCSSHYLLRTIRQITQRLKHGITASYIILKGWAAMASEIQTSHCFRSSPLPKLKQERPAFTNWLL